MTREELVANIRNKVYEKNDREFYADLADTFKVDQNAELTKRMYSLAWQNGHSAGYHEVMSHFEDLVGVFKGG